MVDYQRQLLDELMGRNRNLDPGTKVKEKSWKDSENCKFFIVSQFFY
jgi:LUC7 N_terminus